MSVVDNFGDIFRKRKLYKELFFRASASSGPGGQNVNRVNTKIELRFEVEASSVLSEREKRLVLTKLTNRINKEGVLIISSQTERTQLKNKEAAVNLFFDLLQQTFRVKKIRIKVKPTKSMIRKRLERKKMQSLKKKNRRKTDFDF